jgi:hypothetical protein
MNITSVKHSGLLSTSMRDRVLSIERMIEQVPQVDCPVRHHFIAGGVAREIRIPAGVTLTGAVHKQQSVVILSAGSMTLATEDGPLYIEAPHTMICHPGAKNLATAHEDCVWTNFFVTDETDLDKLVETLSESTAEELLGGANNKQMNNTKKELPCQWESPLA